MIDGAESLALAQNAWLRGEDAEAEALLDAERRRARHVADEAASARVEAELGAFAAEIDEDERAVGHLRHLEVLSGIPTKTRARVFTVSARLGQKRGASMPAPRLSAQMEADAIEAQDPQALVVLAAMARGAGQSSHADSLVQVALRMATPRSYEAALALEERAELLFAADDLLHARAARTDAIAIFDELGLRRASGRAMLRFALSIAAASPAGESPAAWLGRARERLGSCATWRDRAALRAGFRTHGRRLPDAAVAESIVDRVETLDRACSSLRGRLSVNALEVGRAFDDAEDVAGSMALDLDRARESLDTLATRVTPLLRGLEDVGSELLELTGATLVDRDRMRVLVRALADLDGESQVATFTAKAAVVVGAVLEADRTIIADARVDGAARVLGEAGAPGDDAWQGAVLAALRVASRPPGSQPPSLRSEVKPTGPLLVSPIRSDVFVGAIYADKLRRGGQFRESDHHLASLAAEYLAQGIARLYAHEAGRRALAQLETTLDAIRDGVLAIDGKGIVTSFNRAASRVLRISVADALGRPLAALRDLAPLAAVLSSSQRPDGAVVRLAGGSVVVTARPISAGPSAEPGIVATLVELDRAEKLAARITHARPRYGFHDVIGPSASLGEAVRLARQAAQIDASVLITGESGTGKEVIAQAIHTGGPRAGEPFVGINCAALPRELLEAELFGHERGAFTGARTDGAIGKLELAGEGTLLLDEIGDMPLDMQVKLLRVLQERVVVRLGGSEERPVMARVLATTHRNLEEGVERGTFRLDLLYRLRVLTIHIPPLRTRREDVLALATHFVRRVALAQKKKLVDLAPSVVAELGAHDWPGNVRELANVIEREVSLAPADIMILERLSVPFAARARHVLADVPSSGRLRIAEVAGSAVATILPLAEVERRAYMDALDACGGNVTRASRALGVSRANFYAKLRNWNIAAADEPGPETLTKMRTIDATAVAPPRDRDE